MLSMAFTRLVCNQMKNAMTQMSVLPTCDEEQRQDYTEIIQHRAQYAECHEDLHES